jgi:hypothetical protein
MSFALPPIVRLAERLLVEIEQAVRRFPSRYHRYAIGAVLRAQAMSVAKLAHRAWRDRQNQAALVSKLVWEVDELKLSMQLGSRVRAFESFAQFEALIRLAADLGKQTGGWHKQQHPKNQNAGAGNGSQQRVQILSARAASTCEANP